jgi:hypothetical protein
MKQILSAFCILLMSLVVHAQSDSYDGSQNYFMKERAWHPSLGLSYGRLDPYDQSGVYGDSFGVSLIDTVYLKNPNWVTDFGVGLQKFDFQGNKFQGNNGPTIVAASGDARYLLAHRWSVGPVVDAYLNGGTQLGSSNPQALFIGALIDKEFNFDVLQPIKVSLRLDTEVFTSAQANRFVGINIQWSIDDHSRSVVLQ